VALFSSYRPVTHKAIDIVDAHRCFFTVIQTTIVVHCQAFHKNNEALEIIANVDYESGDPTIAMKLDVDSGIQLAIHSIFTVRRSALWEVYHQLVLSIPQKCRWPG
jgi:hypothetical protein